MARTPKPKKMPPIDMLRDHGITQLAEMAINDGAVVFGVMYETASGDFRMATYPASVCVADGLLMNACEIQHKQDQAKASAKG